MGEDEDIEDQVDALAVAVAAARHWPDQLGVAEDFSFATLQIQWRRNPSGVVVKVWEFCGGISMVGGNRA